MQEWQQLLSAGINRASALKAHFPHLQDEDIERVTSRYPVRINRYYLDLIEDINDPIARQVLPSFEEIDETDNIQVVDDPLNEEGDAVVPGLTHRYPDRVLFYVNHQCPVYCRYCVRWRQQDFQCYQILHGQSVGN